MEEIEEDKIANKVIEGLPPSFMVFGSKKELDPLEEFWMNKLTSIERQYDEHVVNLERKLLTDRANRRSIKKQTAKISKLKEELTEQSTEIERLKSQAGSLSVHLKDKEYEAKSLRCKLEKASTVSKNITKRLMDERHTRMQYEKECVDLKTRLQLLEKEKARLLVDVEIKESEKGRVEEREGRLHKEKWAFVRNITELDSECRVQTNANIKLCEDMEKLLGVEKSLEIGLLRERQAMGDMMEEIKAQRQQHHNAMRQLDISIKEKQDVQESLVHAEQKNTDLQRRVKHWQEELDIKVVDNVSQSKEIGELKRRNSNVRCILADTKHKLSLCLSEMKSLTNEKRRAEVDLETAKRHEKSLHLEIKKNELRKFKLAEKILKSHPFMFQRGGSSSQRGHPGASFDRACKNTEIESYQKSIWKLERHRDEVERKLRDLQRKENIYRLKVDKYAGMEKQIFWTGKAMAKLEGDKNRLEQMLKAMESSMPVKVPFKKLVTDPSVLDRLAKNKVLQKRMFHQAQKIEELKFSATKILQFREEQFGAMDHQYEDIPGWKLSFWNRNRSAMITPENLLSGMSIDVMKRTQPLARSLPKPFTDENYYKHYMQHLNTEIPKLKHEIEFLERRKLFIEVEKENEERHKQKPVLEKAKMSVLMPPEEQIVEEPSETSEQNGNDGQCTPELSMHGSSYDDTRKAHSGKNVGKESDKKVPKISKQAAHTRSSSTDDERGDDADAGGSSEDVSDVPSDKS